MLRVFLKETIYKSRKCNNYNDKNVILLFYIKKYIQEHYQLLAL